jgi:D-amino-acid dehydrogenase
MNSGKSDNIIVIGGGVIGAMCAYQLSKAGRNVTIVERDRFGKGCSHGNCGYVSPSHILPLTQPGTIKSTLLTMMKGNSPFKIKPRLSPGFVSWFWNFARRCNQTDMLEAAVGRHEMLQSSKRIYQQIIADEKIECEWQERGILFVFDTKEHFEHYRQTNEMLVDHFGVGATPYDAEQLIEIEPALKPGLGGAWHYECDCHVRPDLLMSSLKEKLQQRGVNILEQTAVDKFVRENGMAVAVQSKNETIEADQIIVATGAWTPFLNKHLGVRIPIEPGKGYSLTMPKPKRMPRIPLIFENARVAITPMESKYRIGSTMEFVGYDERINPKRLNLLRTSAEKYLHDPYCDPIEEEWFGWRPMTWDGKPIIDCSPAMKNVWIAAGHNMLGLSMAAATGQLVKELMLDEKPHIDPAHYALSRFSK